MTISELRALALKAADNWTIANDTALSGALTPSVVNSLLDVAEAARALVEAGFLDGLDPEGWHGSTTAVRAALKRLEA